MIDSLGLLTIEVYGHKLINMAPLPDALALNDITSTSS